MVAPRKTAVVAVGGNALIGAGEHGTVAEESGHARVIAAAIERMIADGWSIAVTHGNGPQVGIILRRSDVTAGVDPDLPPLPLHYCVAETQGGIGFLLVSALANELRARGLPDRVVAVLTQTVVSLDDPAFANPSKPIGSFYGREEAENYRAERGWTIVEDSGRGYRRVVPSPTPLRIVESAAVARLLGEGFTVVTVGGGGVPVVAQPDGELRGVDAVIDKDHASALLAADLGADLLVLCTSVDQVALNYGTPTQRFLDRMSTDEAEQHLEAGQFPAGSMGPKIEAALRFLRSGGAEVLITSIDRLGDALDGRTGTRLTARRNPATLGNRR